MVVKWRSLAAGLAVSALCLWLLLRSIDIGRVGQALAQAESSWLGIAVVFLAASVALRCWRWQLLFLPANRVSYWGTFASTMVGYMLNTVLPGRVGELSRAALISQTDGVGTARALGTILVEKVLDVLVLLLLLGCLTAFLPIPAEMAAAGVSAAVVFGAVAVVLLVMCRYRSAVVSWAARWLDQTPVLRRVRPSSLADLVLSGADSLRQPWLLALHLVVAPSLWLLALATTYAAMRAFRMDVPLTAPALVLAMTNLGMTVPSAPGYVGVYHYIATMALAPFSVDRDVAAAFAFTLHALSFGIFLVGGVLVLLFDLARQRYSIADLWRWRAPSYET
jgi:uncharacterized protein (TIRG00374 family)